MKQEVKVAFASCRPELIAAFVEGFAGIAPDLELFVVSEFSPPAGRWIRYRPDRSWRDNLARCRSALRGRSIRYGAIVLQPGAPYTRLRFLGFLLTGPPGTLFYNHNLDHFTLRPGGLPGLVRHVGWRVREQVVFQTNPGGDVYTWLWRIRHPSRLRRPLSRIAALIAGRVAAMRKRTEVLPPGKKESLPSGISVVIPSRNGCALLERLLPSVVSVSEVIVVDNGSDDGTADFLATRYPEVRVEVSREPLSFARAVNTGIRAARYSHVCLLNNDMAPEKGFFFALWSAFDHVPELFCATAEIRFPEGKRREETGKAVMRPTPSHRTSVPRSSEFPIHCIEPIPGEDLTWVLYGSGGCSLYDTGKLRAIGGIGEVYEPAYVEDLDAGVRGWQRGWPTVFVPAARTVHDHRTTTSRYYSEGELAQVLERNYLRFLARTISGAKLFRTLWDDAIDRLNRMAALDNNEAAEKVLSEAWRAPFWVEPAYDMPDHESMIFALGSGDVAVFPGRAKRHGKTVLVAGCYSPYPLSHGGAVRMYNLMRRGTQHFTQVLVTFVDDLHTPPAALLAICAGVVQVRRRGSHTQRDSGRPDVVEEFDSLAFRAALQQTIRQWAPEVVQLEFTQMAQYAGDCGAAKTVLVEHDVTVDLYRQLLGLHDDYDLREELRRWTKFEAAAWRAVDCVVTMSERDRRSVQGARSVVTVGNGVDLERFQPNADEGHDEGHGEPEADRLLFIGSFNHLPNLLALDFFLREVWPLLGSTRCVLHVIAGSRYRYFLERWRDRVGFTLEQPHVEVEDFVADVRPAYRRAAVVIAPLLASAGTNIKIMEAMAMGKAVVSTPGGVNGLDDLRPGHDILVESDPAAFASAIEGLLGDSGRRRTIERNARATAERVYSWDAIAEHQREMYLRLMG